MGFLQNYLHGGTTTAISACEVHVPGTPHDVEAVKALAIAAKRCWDNLRPGGMRVYGGNVILEASHDLNNLIAQFYNPRLIAESGEAGMGKGMDGHAGKDLIVKVPCGTLVWKLPAEEKPE